MTEQASRRIYWMRLICAIMVIGIHCENSAILNQSNDNWSSMAQNWITNNIYCIAVPVFFMLSGFFCYYRIETKDYWERWKKRVFKTAYLYFLWNGIYTGYHFIKVILLNSGHIGKEVSLAAILKGFLLYEYNEPWWFMLQLLLLEICSPFILKLLKGSLSRYLLAIGMVCFAVIQSFGVLGSEYIRSQVWIWYYIGAYIGYFKPDILLDVKEKEWEYGIAAGVGGELALIIFQTIGVSEFSWLPVLIMAIGFCFVCKIGKYERKFPNMLKCTFFIYAVHQLFGGILYRLENQLFTIDVGMSFLLFLMNPIILLTLLVLCANVLRKLGMYQVLTMER